MLCESSTYFKAALNNGFAETAAQKITLDDDDPEIFRTYAAWLFQGEISTECFDEFDNIDQHLFDVYIFADKRAIRCLANDVVTEIASLWYTDRIALNTTAKYLPRIPPQCTLYELVVDNLVLESRDATWDEDDWEAFGSHPKEIIVEMYKREQAFPGSFQDSSDCFDSICHYHEHKDDDEQRKCIGKRERGRNVAPSHSGPWKQVEWRW